MQVPLELKSTHAFRGRSIAFRLFPQRAMAPAVGEAQFPSYRRPLRNAYKR